MADNVNLTAGDGTVVAASDNIGGVNYQRIKLIHGADGVNAGDVSTANGLPVQGQGYVCALSITRTADTNAYAAGDVIGTGTSSGNAVLTLAGIGPTSGDIIITDADYRVDLSAVPSGMTSFRLHLYDATPPSALADNAAWDLPSGDRANYLGYIDLGTPVDLGSTLFVQASQINKKLRMGAATSLFAYLQTIGGYTPASATVQSVRVNAIGV